MMKRATLAAIAAYQRYLSPLKGFSCAFRVHTGRDSCSQYGKRAIGRHGVAAGLLLLKRRMEDCGHLHHRHPQAIQRPALSARHRLQAGFCSWGEVFEFGCDFFTGWARDARCCSWRYNTSPTEDDDNYPGNTPRRARRKKSATPKKPKLNDNVGSAPSAPDSTDK
ncbi:membrane protein insertion efficiency factor YidD [Duganella vulcania]|nr:membrane protein insertion efficiency factor YidD [Duganella vulcania]